MSIPFSFLPFSIEFRILPQPSSILLLTDANNKSLAQIALDRKGLLVLTLFANMSKVEQLPQSGLDLKLNFLDFFLSINNDCVCIINYFLQKSSHHQYFNFPSSLDFLW